MVQSISLSNQTAQLTFKGIDENVAYNRIDLAPAAEVHPICGDVLRRNAPKKRLLQQTINFLHGTEIVSNGSNCFTHVVVVFLHVFKINNNISVLYDTARRRA